VHNALARENISAIFTWLTKAFHATPQYYVYRPNNLIHFHISTTLSEFRQRK